MKVGAFVYARSDSARFPGKVFSEILGVPLFELVLRRAKAVSCDAVTLLTSHLAKDDILSRAAEASGYRVFRGHETDLVQRTLEALKDDPLDYFIRINGDSPWFCPELAGFALTSIPRADFVSNLSVRTFPYGVAVELVSSGVFRELCTSVFDFEREHVTQHLYRQLQVLRFVSIVQSRDDSSYRLTVDFPADAVAQQALFLGLGSPLFNYWEAHGLARPCWSAHANYL